MRDGGGLGIGERGAVTELLGFVDLQVNGYNGVSFSSDQLTLQSCVATCVSILAEGGCAAFMPTVITSPLATYDHVLPILAAAAECAELAGRVIGLHLEGPFISPAKGAVGTHPVPCVRAPMAAGVSLEGAQGGGALLRRWQQLARGRIRLLTLAPEVEGAADLCAEAAGLDIRVSLGHMLGQARATACMWHVPCCAWRVWHNPLTRRARVRVACTGRAHP